MKRFAAVAITVGVLTASCSGHGGSTSMPPLGQSTQNGSQSPRAAVLASAPTGWANTHTQAVSIVNASDLGAASLTQSITVRVGLALHNQSQLVSAVASGQQVSDAAFMATYAPKSTEASAVTNYLSSNGLSNITVEPNNLLISATGTIAQVQKAFNTSIHSYSGSGANFIANVTPAYVPSSLGGIVVAVLGLNTLQSVKPTPKVTSCQVFGASTPPQECLRFYDPATFQVAYHAGSRLIVPP